MLSHPELYNLHFKCCRLFARLYMEAPLITDNALDILKQVSAREVSAIHLLQQLVLKRPAKQLLFLNILLEQTSHHVAEVSRIPW